MYSRRLSRLRSDGCLSNKAWTEFLFQSSEDASHRDWQNVRKNNLQNMAKELEKPTTTIGKNTLQKTVGSFSSLNLSPLFSCIRSISIHNFSVHLPISVFFLLHALAFFPILSSSALCKLRVPGSVCGPYRPPRSLADCPAVLLS